MAIGVATPELAMQRVRNRVEQGGHDAYEAMIRTNWELCPKKTPELLACADRFFIYDNSTEGFKEIAQHSAERPFTLGDIKPHDTAGNPYLAALFQNMALREQFARLKVSQHTQVGPK